MNDDDHWLDVAAAEDVPRGGYEILETDDCTVAVFNVDGELHAFEDVCTHDGEELTGGPIDGDQIICPRHGARFCLRTGKALTSPAYEDLPGYPVRIKEGRIQVLIKP